MSRGAHTILCNITLPRWVGVTRSSCTNNYSVNKQDRVLVHPAAHGPTTPPPRQNTPAGQGAQVSKLSRPVEFPIRPVRGSSHGIGIVPPGQKKRNGQGFHIKNNPSTVTSGSFALFSQLRPRGQETQLDSPKRVW